MTASRHIAIVGAGIAAITCARTLVQAGHRVTVFEKSHTVGGRMATRNSPFGTFDTGAQYFTVRDPRFVQALQTTPNVCKRWSANTVQVLDEHGRVAAVGLPAREPHWVAVTGMSTLVRRWAQPLVASQSMELQTQVTGIERDSLNKAQWQLRALGVGDSTPCLRWL
jgi:predicted NAD/FAD-dependent oxidoreductase